jgi:hypothetical protein
MLTDNVLLIFSFFCLWILLFFLVVRSERKMQQAFIHFGLHITYSFYFLYKLLYTSGEGLALAWWFALILFLGIHFLIGLIQFVYIVVKSKNR